MLALGHPYPVSPLLFNEKGPEVYVPRGLFLLDGAGCRIRTDDLPLTRRVLYQLS